MDPAEPTSRSPGALPDRWYGLRIEPLPAGGGADLIAVRVHVPAESAIVAGHFPGDPIVPGYALLALVSAIAGERRFRNVRFRAPARPGDELELRVTADRRFSVQCGTRTVASGALGDDA